MKPANPQPIEAATKFELSHKVALFTESVIREMTRLAIANKAVNLSQGFPDFPAPAEIKRAAQDAVAADINQYAITWGAKNFRDAITAKWGERTGITIDPEREITVCCGSTESLMSTMMAISNPGDEVVIFEPFYENYGPDGIISGATPRFVKLHAPDWRFDPDELAAAFGPKTKAIILNTPNNPTGKVFERAELELIRDLCVKWNCLAIADEIYEYMLYDGAEHISLATLEGMRDRTVTINALSKTYGVTGWRVGWAIAPPEVTFVIRKCHDFLTVGAAAPLQDAGATALRFPHDYYTKLATDYAARRERLLGILEKSGFRCYKPHGAYYIMTDISGFGFPDDVAFAKHLVTEIGVAAVPGSSFYRDPAHGRTQLRFTFCKTEKTFQAAEERLAKLKPLAAQAR